MNYRFSSKEAATEAIVGLHLTEINGHTVKCSWGKKGDDNASDFPMSSSPVSPVMSTMNPQSFNIPLATDYCQMVAQQQFVSCRLQLLIGCGCRQAQNVAHYRLLQPIGCMGQPTEVAIDLNIQVTL